MTLGIASRRPFAGAVWHTLSPARIALVILTLVPLILLGTPQALTLIRNSFIAEPGLSTDFEWTGLNPPAGFTAEQGPAPDEFESAVHNVLGDTLASPPSFAKGLLLARHLGNGRPRGGAIQSDTLNTYRTIQRSGGGYCADYSQAFTGLALAANLPVREWGVSFGNFNGDGHAFNEIYDTDLEKWVFLDSFFSWYAVDPRNAHPLSVLELFDRLESDQAIGVIPIDPHHFGFKNAEMALTYYRRGLDRLMLSFGNNVFSYDRHPVVEALQGAPAVVRQGLAIVAGAYPRLKIVPTDENRDEIEFLAHVRLAAVIFVVIYVITLLLVIRSFLRRSDDDAPGVPQPSV